MATTSMQKDFVIRNRKAFERFRKTIEVNPKRNVERKVKISSSLAYGEEKLKHFSFR